MKILVMDMFGNNVTLDVNQVPRIGDTLPLFHEPFPKVSNVLWNLRGGEGHAIPITWVHDDIDAIVSVK